MKTLLYIASFLSFAIGLAHSYLGERFILIRLFKRGNLPKLLGGTEFTKQTLRFAWHITTILLWAFAALFLLMADGQIEVVDIAWVSAYTFLLIGLIALVASKGRHLSWIVFLVIGLIGVYMAVA